MPAGTRRRRVGALVAALALVVVAGVGWASRPQEDPPPADDQASSTIPLAAQVVGLWKGLDQVFPRVLVLRSDGSVSVWGSAEDLLASAATVGRYRVDGDALSLPGAVLGSGCDLSFAVHKRAQGWLQLDETGTVCGSAPALPQFTLVRLSPRSQGGLAYPPPVPTDQALVRTTNPLHGVWLLQGSGQMLVVGATGALPPVPYRVDGSGSFDGAPRGELVVTGPGEVSLTSAAGCVTRLDRVTSMDYSFTARVAADACGTFAGRTALSWVLVL